MISVRTVVPFSLRRKNFSIKTDTLLFCCGAALEQGLQKDSLSQAGASSCRENKTGGGHLATA